MTKLKFTVLVDEVFNEFDCKLLNTSSTKTENFNLVI